ncbi:MAG: GNAT family N-acetyltransferase [Bacteroidota bacterium]
MPITLRPATREDLPTLLEFEQGIILAERPMDPTLRSDPISYYDIGELIDREDAEVLVAVDGDLLVGSGYVKEKASRHYVQPAVHAFLGFMYVRPEYRGQGINGRVTEALLNWARTRGLTEARLTVYTKNPGAIRAYDKVGFEQHLIEMRKPLE